MLAATSFAYLAYYAPTSRLTNLYALSAALAIGIAPFTGLVMKPTNDALIARAAAGEKGIEKGATNGELVRKWAGLNTIRGLLPLAGAGVAAWAVLFEGK